MTPEQIREIARKDCEMLGIDPDLKTPTGPFLDNIAIKTVDHVIKAIEACGYKIEQKKAN